MSIWIVAQRTLLPPSWKQSKNQTLRICIWFWRIFHLFICFNGFIFHFYILPFSKRQYVFISWKTMIINTNYIFCMFTSFNIFICLYFLKKNILSSKYLLLLLFFLYYYLFIFCYVSLFRGNSLNSRAGLESKEFRFFSTFFLVEIQCFFSKNHRGKSKTHLIFSKKHIECQSVIWKIIVEKSRNSLNSMPALEFKEFPRK